MLRQEIPTMSLLPPVSPFSESSNSSTDELVRIASQRVMASHHQYMTMVSDGGQSDNSDISATTVSTIQSLESVKSNQTSATTKPSYQRHPKPPYSYLGMIIMAIEMSPDKALSLSEIHLSLVSMFPFFRGTYRGWKDSVRHTLSSGACFFKCLRGRINKWAVHLHLAPYNALLRQDTAVSRSTYWPPTIYDYLKVPEVMLPSKYNTISSTAITSDNTIQTKRPTDFSIDRILTPEIVDDSRPLLTDDTSPTFNKMTLKLKTRKTTTRRHQSSPLTKLVTDSASKWGVTEETAVDQLRSLCQIMDTTSALQQHQSSEQLLPVKSEIPSPSPTDTSYHSHPSDLQESSSHRYSLPSASSPSYCMTPPSCESPAYQQNLPFSTVPSYTANHHHQPYATEYLQQLYAAHQYQQLYAAHQQQQYIQQQQLYTQQLYQQQLAAHQSVYQPSFQGYQHNTFFHEPADFNTPAVDLSSPSCQ
ncbi:forkhead box protein H1-like [Mytilus trossulus]|uniref:forkhead box protein H1-like n=1 Tax=Mytilus trossulus TaxID=6551 RepID=UPI00300640BD